MEFTKVDYNIEVIGFGALNIDNLFKVDKIVDKDGESFIKSRKSSFGGSAANTIIGLSRLGIKTSYIGKIAEDDEGELLEVNLVNEGVYLNNLIYSTTGNSGSVYGFIDTNGDRALYVDPGVNDEIKIGEINYNNIKGTKIIHYSSFVGDSFKAQCDLIDQLEDNVILSFDPGILYAEKGVKELEKILKRTNILLINETELYLLFKNYFLEKKDKKELSFRDIAIYLLEEGMDTVVVKRGINGVYAVNEKEEVKIPIFKVKSIDTTAAGDSFNTGFLYSYLNSYSLECSCIIGNWIASKVVEDIGINNLPTLNELEEFKKILKIAINNDNLINLFD